MPVVHFEEADSAERTRIGEGLVKFARADDRLETGRAEGKYFLAHAARCDEGAEQIEAGDEFYFDTDAGGVPRAEHDRTRRAEKGG